MWTKVYQCSASDIALPNICQPLYTAGFDGQAWCMKGGYEGCGYGKGKRKTEMLFSKTPLCCLIFFIFAFFPHKGFFKDLVSRLGGRKRGFEEYRAHEMEVQ